MTAAPLDRARALLADASQVVVLTGAGVSAESGVPTFRGPEGLWKSHRPEELATPAAFNRDPRLVWEWYAWRREKVGACRPNAGHRALARLALARPGVTLVTQNVDGLHTLVAQEEARAANPGPALPLELHGSLFRVRCTACRFARDDRSPVDASSRATLPRCPDCGALLRPAVVWFGEALDGDVLSVAFGAAQTAHVCVVAGTSAVVHPAASIPLATARSGGAIIEVNTEATPLSSTATVTLAGPAGTVLPQLVAPS
jgi:NAD-dependent deacetylase